MRIYNATGSLQRIPLNPKLGGTQKIEVSPNTVSTSFMPSTDFLSMMVSIFSPSEVAFIVSGPFEINMCANIPVTAAYVVQSIDEAVQRFAKPEEPTTPVAAEPVSEPDPVIKEVVSEEPVVVEETPVTEPVTEEIKEETPVVEEEVVPQKKTIARRKIVKK